MRGIDRRVARVEAALDYAAGTRKDRAERDARRDRAVRLLPDVIRAWRGEASSGLLTPAPAPLVRRAHLARYWVADPGEYPIEVDEDGAPLTRLGADGGVLLAIRRPVREHSYRDSRAHRGRR